MRVLQINAVYGHGSTGTIVRDLENLCYDEGLECYVASPDTKVMESRNGYVIGSSFDHKLHALLSRVNGKQAYFSKCATKKFLTYMDIIKPDVVHMHNLHSNYIHLPLLLSYLAEKDIATVVTLHDCWFYTGGCFHYSAANCYKWQKACGHCPKKTQDTPAYFHDCSAAILSDKKKLFQAIPRLIVTGVSNWITREAEKSFFKGRRMEVIYNGIDLDVFKETPSNLKSEIGLDGKYVILGPASKWLAKENTEALKYFSEHLKDDEFLLLYGASDLTMKCPNHIKLYGYTTNRQQLAALYTMADVFVNCSHEESLSLINLEAQACGTPVVTYGITGMTDTINEVNSFSVTDRDFTSLYNKVRYCREHHSESDPHDCRTFVKSKFGVKENYLKYIRSYKSFNV